MKNKSLTIILLVSFFYASPVYSEVDPEGINLIREFIMASRNKDHEAATEAWYKINEEPEVVDYMRTDLPKFYHAFQMRAIAIQAKRLYEDSNKFGAVGPSTKTLNKLRPNSKSRASNNFFRGAPRQNNSNFVGRTRISNADIVHLIPNQSRVSNQRVFISNQETIRRRVRR